MRICKFLTIFYLLGCAATVYAEDHPACTNVNRESWLNLRSTYVQRYLDRIRAEWSIDASGLAEAQFDEDRVFSDLNYKIEHCSQLLTNSGLDSCFTNLRTFLRGQRQLRDPRPAIGLRDPALPPGSVMGGYAFLMSDEDYLASHPQAVMELPAEFQQAEPSAWIAAARARGAEILEFPSNLTGDTRIVFYEQVNGVDRYMFADHGEDGYTLVGMLAVEPRDHNGQNRFLFREFSPPASATPMAVRLSIKNNVESCIHCHTNGAREIVPGSGPLRTVRLPNDNAHLSDEELARQRLSRLNQRIRSYGMPNWNGLLRVSDFGPTFGEGRRASCMNCHNGIERSELHGAIFPREIVRKVRDEQSMPAGIHGLSRADRELLLEDLFSNHAQRFRDWIDRTPCPIGPLPSIPDREQQPAQ